MKSILSKPKNASIQDPITVGAFILMIAATIFVIIHVWYGFDGAIREAVSGSVANETVTNTLDKLTITYSYIDYMIPILIGSLMILSLIFAFKTGASIVYAFMSLLVWGFALLMAAVYTNIFEQFKLAFPVVSANYPILVFLMMNFKWVVLSWIFLISLVMFTQNKKETKSLERGLEEYYG